MLHFGFGGKQRDERVVANLEMCARASRPWAHTQDARATSN